MPPGLVSARHSGYIRGMQHLIPQTRDIVLIGGGHAHALVLMNWAMRPLPGARMTVINPGPTAPYSGMLPGFVAGHYTRDDLDIDLVRLARAAGARVILGHATGIDRRAKTITVPGRPPIAYDVASIDIGITTEMPDLPGFADHAIPAKPLGRFASQWAAFRETGGAVAVIGAGVAGAELAMAMAHAMRMRGHDAPVHLIDRSDALSEVGPQARARLRDALAQNAVQLHEQCEVTAITDQGLTCADGQQIAAQFITGAAAPHAQAWLSDIGVDTHEGYVTVGPTLQSSDPAIFAAGDCAHLSWSPRPKAGVYAVREAPILYANLIATLTGAPLRKYRPQKGYLKLISLGGKSALAEKAGITQDGALLWRWKDRIDRKFMGMFRALKPMQAPLPGRVADGVRETLGDKPMCGGCGAKVGRGALGDVLSTLAAPARDDVVPLPGDDAALLRVGGARQVLTTDHLRAVTDDPVIMTQIAAHHALGDIWAMGAEPQAATVNLILPRLSGDLQRRTLQEIMTTAHDVLRIAGADIVGGHSAMGSELTIGFSITGLCPDDPITLAGAQAGDALILTKPIGSGTILAAEMAMQARGDVVAACYDIMCQGQAGAAAILRRHAHAMTDVTGFGLAGHLGGICEASALGAVLNLDDIPMMAGAVDLAERGTRSTLWDDNRAAAPVMIAPDTALAAMVYDPQTAGGLLAAVPVARVDDILRQLRDQGVPGALIGHMTEGSGITLR